jgi:RNA polymerase sigma factor (sigma-70 family)
MKDPARDQTITQHRTLVCRISKRFYRTWCCTGLELDDLIAFGTRGLIRAVDQFDPSKGVSFTSFAGMLIEGAIRDGVRRECNWFGRRLAGVATMVHLDDLAPDGWEDWLGQLDEQGSPTRTIWNGRPMHQPTSDGDLGIQARLDDEVRRLPQRQFRLIHLHYYEGKKLSDAAKEMGVQRSSVSRLRKKALQRLRDTLENSANRIGEAVRRESPATGKNRKRSGISGPTGRLETTTRALGLDELLADVRAAA